MLDEKITDVVENLEEVLKQRGALSFTLSIGVTDRLYRLGLVWEQAGVNGPLRMNLDRFVNRKHSGASVLDPIALAADAMLTELNKE